MRLIGTLEDQEQAQRFADFLYGEGIESQIDENAQGSCEIWVLDEDQIEQAAALLQTFSENPDASQFLETAQAGAKQRRHDQKQAVPKRGRIVDGRTMFHRPSVSFGVLTMTLIVISVGAALITKLGQEIGPTTRLSITQCAEDGSYVRGLPEIRGGQIWRLFTPMFLHFSIMHILFNMLWLRDLGSMIEARKSWWYLLLLVLVMAGLSNLAQYKVSGPMFGGMSGVVYGLLGYVWMQSRFNPASGLVLHPQTVTLMIIWFFLCLSGAMGSIANTAHGVGAVVGIAWGFAEAQIATRHRYR